MLGQGQGEHFESFAGSKAACTANSTSTSICFRVVVGSHVICSESGFINKLGGKFHVRRDAVIPFGSKTQLAFSVVKKLF